MTKVPLTLLIATAIACSAASDVHATLLTKLQDHCNSFIGLNYPGAMTATASEIETISPSSNIDALANAIVDNWYVIDPGTSTFVQLSGPEKQTFINFVLKPKMVNGALVASVQWVWGSQTITEYALVNPAATGPGDLENIIDGVVGMYFVPELSVKAANPFHQGFKNGFGTHVADYDASLKCTPGNACSGDATCNESRVGCSCDVRKEVKCLPNGDCQMDVAFVGYCGFPSVEFEAKGFKFKVSGWGWQYYNASITLDEPCHCTTNQRIGMNDNSYVPRNLAITEGTTVTWTNMGSSPHSTVNGNSPSDPDAGKLWDSDFVFPGQSFSHTFDLAGTFNYFDHQYWVVGMTGTINATVGVPEGSSVSVGPAYAAPNPTFREVDVVFTLSVREPVSVTIFDLTGATVAHLFKGSLEAGAHAFHWNGKTVIGKPADSGVYFARMDTPFGVHQTRFVLLRSR